MIKFKAKPLGATQSAAEAGKQVKADKTGQGDHEQPFIIKDFPQNHVLWHIHKNGTRTEAARHHNVVHASDLDPARKWCAREPALLTLHNMKRPSGFASTAQRMVWQMGYKGAELVMEMIPREKLWGKWRCLACGQTTELMYHPGKCPFCEAHHRALEYQEVLLRDPVTGVIGSVDLFVDILGNGTKTALEIKTTGNDSFKALIKPEFDHEWRTMLYLRLAAATPYDFAAKHHINTEEARVIYVTKEGYADNPKIKEWKLADWSKSAMKEYWVTRNDDMTSNQMTLALSYRLWRQQWDGGWSSSQAGHSAALANLPARVDTATAPGCTRCKGCPVKKECWKGTA